jgi:hypothetical protein
LCGNIECGDKGIENNQMNIGTGVTGFKDDTTAKIKAMNLGRLDTNATFLRSKLSAAYPAKGETTIKGNTIR